MYEAQAWRLVRRLGHHAGIKSAGQLSPHSLRHTFATSLDNAGGMHGQYVRDRTNSALRRRRTQDVAEISLWNTS